MSDSVSSLSDNDSRLKPVICQQFSTKFSGKTLRLLFQL